MKNPRLVGVKQFWAESGRYIVFLFSANKFDKAKALPMESGSGFT